MEHYIGSYIKNENRRTVYRILWTRGEISRSEISRITGISMPTVLKIIQDFIEKGIVIETGNGETQLGRKPHLFCFDPKAAFSIGVEYERSEIKLGLVDLNGDVTGVIASAATKDLLTTITDVLPAKIQELIRNNHVSEKKILGIGISIPGIVNPQKKIVMAAPLLGIPTPLDCSSALAELAAKTGFKVNIENDVNAVAYAEYHIRKGQGIKDLIFYRLSRGLGAGIILNGEIRFGSNFFAGEIGYMIFDKNYQASPTDGGWLEEKLSAPDENGELPLHMALCIANTNTVLDVDRIVLGVDPQWGEEQKILGQVNACLKRFCLYDVKCEPRKCEEPFIAGAGLLIAEERIISLLS